MSDDEVDIDLRIINNYCSIIAVGVFILLFITLMKEYSRVYLRKLRVTNEFIPRAQLNNTVKLNTRHFVYYFVQLQLSLLLNDSKPCGHGFDHKPKNA